MFIFRHNLRHHEISFGQILTATLAIGLLSLGASEGFGAVIKLRDGRCSTNSNVVMLGDVAEVLEADPSRATALRQVILGPAPGPGGELLLDHEQIKTRLQAVGVNPLEIEFAGRSQAWVRGAAQVSKERIEAERQPKQISPVLQQKGHQLLETAVEQALSRRYPQAGRFQVSARVTAEQAGQFAPGSIQQISVTGGNPPFSAEQPYLVEITSNKGGTKVLQVPCTATVVPRVLAVLRPVRRGEVIRIEDLAWRNPTDAEIRRPPTAQAQEVIGRELVRDLAEGEAITAASVRVIPLVNSGDVITVYSRRGGITVRCDVKAMGTAGLGETVLVQHGGDSRNRITARVTGYHEAEISNEDPSRGTMGNTPAGTNFNVSSSSGGNAR